MSHIFNSIKNKETCKGLVFSDYFSSFYSKGRLETRKGLRVLKGASCKKCLNMEHGAWSYIQEYLIESGEDIDRLCDKKIDGYSTFRAIVDIDGYLTFKKISKIGKSLE